MKIFITGGTTGIGLALAESYLQDVHQVGICGRDLTKLPVVLTKKFPLFKSYAVDVLDSQNLSAAVEDFAQGELDLMIANAGISDGMKSKVPNFETVKKVLNINILGVVNAFEVAAKLMLPKKILE